MLPSPFRSLPAVARRLALAAVLAAPIRAAEPVARWSFGQEEETRLIEHGGVHRDLPGPRPPEFPDFEAGNLAVKLDGKGAHFSMADRGPHSAFDFSNGDTITLEGWVNIADLQRGESVYVIGKGRTGDPGFAKDNQNWPLRLHEVEGKACANFLFARPLAARAPKESHWHRWTSAVGFAPGSGWHHVAVS